MKIIREIQICENRTEIWDNLHKDKLVSNFSEKVFLHKVPPFKGICINLVMLAEDV
jgi:hypothetical protein